MGVVAEPKLDWAQMQKWKGEVVGKLTGGVKQLIKASGTQLLVGTATVTGKNRVEVKQANGETVTVEAAKGIVIASSVDELHGNNHIDKQTALTENGDVINGFGDTPNRHDILTGSKPDGTAFSGADDMTCGNYTRSGEGSIMVGHADRKGTNPDPVANASWNSSHKSAGCSTELLAKTDSAGYLYCFATN